jgi:hypothetical protein
MKNNVLIETLEDCIAACLQYRTELENHVSEIAQEMRTHTWFLDNGKKLVQICDEVLSLLLAMGASLEFAQICIQILKDLRESVLQTDDTCRISAGDTCCQEWCKETIVVCDNSIACCRHLLSIIC